MLKCKKKDFFEITNKLNYRLIFTDLQHGKLEEEYHTVKIDEIMHKKYQKQIFNNLTYVLCKV